MSVHSRKVCAAGSCSVYSCLAGSLLTFAWSTRLARLYQCDYLWDLVNWQLTRLQHENGVTCVLLWSEECRFTEFSWMCLSEVVISLELDGWLQSTLLKCNAEESWKAPGSTSYHKKSAAQSVCSSSRSCSVSSPVSSRSPTHKLRALPCIVCRCVCHRQRDQPRRSSTSVLSSKIILQQSPTSPLCLSPQTLPVAARQPSSYANFLVSQQQQQQQHCTSLLQAVAAALSPIHHLVVAQWLPSSYHIAIILDVPLRVRLHKHSHTHTHGADDKTATTTTTSSRSSSNKLRQCARRLRACARGILLMRRFWVVSHQHSQQSLSSSPVHSLTVPPPPAVQFRGEQVHQ